MRQAGVTLLELLTVLAISVILLGIGVPSYGNLISHNRLAATTNQLVVDLQRARSESIKRGVRVTLCKTSNATAAAPACDTAAAWHQGWLVFVDEGTRGVLDSQDQLLSIGQGVSNGASISTANFGDYVSYLSNGMSQGPNKLGNGTFDLCLEHELRKVVLSVTGRIRLTNGSC